MKRLTILACIIAIASISVASNIHGSYYEATCTGAKNCKACKNCKYCKHCAKEKGSCGVCK